MMQFFQEPENWVAVAFVIFVGVLIYVGAHSKMIEALDRPQRPDQGRARRGAPAARGGRQAARRISAQAEARPSARPPRSSPSAKAEAERIAAEARAKMEDFVARRTKMAEAKIAQAEAQALADVRAAAADAAVAAAETILRDTAKGQVADDLIAQGIADVKAKLN